MRNNGFFSVIISLVSISVLLFNVLPFQNYPNYYPEFISKNEMQYLYLNNLSSSEIEKAILSQVSCNYDKVDLENSISLELSKMENEFNDSSFKSKINLASLQINNKLLTFVYDINNTYTKGNIEFNFAKSFTFKKLIFYDIIQNTNGKFCTYGVTDLDSGILEIQRGKNIN